MVTETIDHTILHRLVETGAVRAAHVVGTSGGWALTVKFGLNERPQAAQCSRQIRLFKKLETLGSYLKDVGLVQFDVDASNYSPDSQNRSIRPDRSAALKRAHEAMAYEAWFREQVQTSIDDPRPAVSDEEARRRFAVRKNALRKEA